MTTQAPHPQTSRSPSRNGAIITLVIGTVLTVCGPVLGILIGALALVPSALDLADSTARLAPTATVELHAGESVFLLAKVADLEAASASDCTAEASSGTTATISYEPASALNTLVNGTRYESFARATADTGGTYTLACNTSVDVIVAPPFEVGSLFAPFSWWTAGGLLVSVIGIVLVIVGIVRLTARTPTTP